MNFVLDANVLVSAFAFPGTCRMLFESCVPPHTMSRSVKLQEEVRRILMEKIHLPEPVINSGLARWSERSAVFVPSPVPMSACRDRNDLHVLGLAVASGADLIVTGDHDLLVLGSYVGIEIVRPAEAGRRLRPPPAPGSGGAGLAAERGPRYGRRRKRNR